MKLDITGQNCEKFIKLRIYVKDIRCRKNLLPMILEFALYLCLKYLEVHTVFVINFKIKYQF